MYTTELVYIFCYDIYTLLDFSPPQESWYLLRHLGSHALPDGKNALNCLVVIEFSINISRAEKRKADLRGHVVFSIAGMLQDQICTSEFTLTNVKLMGNLHQRCLAILFFVNKCLAVQKNDGIRLFLFIYLTLHIEVFKNLLWYIASFTKAACN